ncbi:sigma-70 family RNA polymerase sigma factor [Alicyclobacillus acidocaldarius]|nr:sigma-70 family RNA polymerase sigma factor [Alicyclobacillus acidocaldarius]
MGSSPAFEQYIPYIYRLAQRLVRYRRSAMVDEQDLVSVAMSALWQRGREQALDEKYAKQIIKYAMLTLLRNSSLLKMPRSVPMAQAIEAYQKAKSADELERVPAGNPIEQWEQDELVREIVSKMAELPRQDQILLSLVFEQSLSFQDVATVLGLTKSQVYHRYRAILKELRVKLGLSADKEIWA